MTHGRYLVHPGLSKLYLYGNPSLNSCRGLIKPLDTCLARLYHVLLPTYIGRYALPFYTDDHSPGPRLLSNAHLLHHVSLG